MAGSKLDLGGDATDDTGAGALMATTNAQPTVSMERAWIQLEPSDDIPPTGLFVGVNGRGFLLRTGVPLHVPVSILEVLDHAVASVPVFDPNTRQVVSWQERPKYQYRRVAAPADA